MIMLFNKTIINTLLIGQIAPLANSKHLSAINKQAVFDAQKVTKMGFINDHQADRRFHGGFDKAIHHYPFEHYNFWKTLLPDCAVLNRAGAFGENLSTIEMTEKNVMIGDRYKVGTVILEVSQPRQPCWKLNLRFDHPHMARDVQQQIKTGWYYRVLEEGIIQQGDTIELLERPYPDYALSMILDTLFIDCLNSEKLHQLINLPLLPIHWIQTFKKRLETQQIEDWQPRLYQY